MARRYPHYWWQTAAHGRRPLNNLSRFSTAFSTGAGSTAWGGMAESKLAYDIRKASRPAQRAAPRSVRRLVACRAVQFSGIWMFAGGLDAGEGACNLPPTLTAARLFSLSPDRDYEERLAMKHTLRAAEEVLDFWFGSPGTPEHGTRRDVWFRKDPRFDAEIDARFRPLWERAREGALTAWNETPSMLLALIVLCDQFPRNMFRGQALAFATDSHALAAARSMVDRGWDRDQSLYARAFIYLPFEHAESMAEQDRGVALFAALRGSPDGDNYYDYALRHRAVIQRFGRFPHRNQVLGRTSSEDEVSYLGMPGAGF